MRRLLVQTPRGRGREVLEMARAFGGKNLDRVEAEGDGGPLDLVSAHVPNAKVEAFIEGLRPLPEARVTLLPLGVLALGPPRPETPRGVTNVEHLSPLEVYLAGLQSVGSWRGLLEYAAAAGVVVWIGLYTNTVYLLIAAMLLAPFAGPAMNAAIATARGDLRLLRESVLRYAISLAVTVLVCAGLSLLLGQEEATILMVATGQVASVAALLPLAAGAAGALNLFQSDRNSLVSGTAVGALIAASLAPPAGLVGMAAAVGRWEMLKGGVFLLLLQLAAINLSGSLVFRAYGLKPKGARYGRGHAWLFPAALTFTAAALAALLAWQFSGPPELQRTTRAERAAEEIQRLVDESGLAYTAEADVRFTGYTIPGQNTLLCVVYVQRREGVALSKEEVGEHLRERIGGRLLQEGFDVTPLVNVVVLEPAR